MKPNKTILGKAVFAVMLLLSVAAGSLLFEALPVRFAPLSTAPARLSLVILEDALRVSLLAACLASPMALSFADALPLAASIHLTRILPVSIALAIPKTPLGALAAALLIALAVRPARTYRSEIHTP